VAHFAGVQLDALHGQWMPANHGQWMPANHGQWMPANQQLQHSSEFSHYLHHTF
jgi:hypothetical protein